jgi:hypothetical protein
MARMTTVQLRPVPATNPASDVAAIWNEALENYEQITGLQVQYLDRANNVDQILDEIHEKETRFNSRRHDGSKLDKFRTLVSKSLAPIQSVGDIVSQATKAVGKLPTLTWSVAIICSCDATDFPSK